MDKKEKNEGPYDTLKEKHADVAAKNKNSWAFSVSQDQQQQGTKTMGILNTIPGVPCQDIDDGMLPTAAQRAALNQWPPSRIVGLLAVVLFIIFAFVEIETPKDSEVSFKHKQVFSRSVCNDIIVAVQRFQPKLDGDLASTAIRIV